MAIYVALGIGISLQPLLFFYPTVVVTTTTIFLAKNVAVYRQHSPDKEGGGTRVHTSVHAPLRPLPLLLLPGHLAQQLP